MTQIRSEIAYKESDAVLRLLRERLIFAEGAAAQHYEAARRWEKLNNRLGFWAALLAGIVGTSVFASIGEKHVPLGYKIAAGAIGVAASVLATLQTSLHPRDRAEAHRETGAEYGRATRLITEVGAVAPRSREEAQSCLAKIDDMLGQAADAAPSLADVDRRRGEQKARSPDEIQSGAPAKKP